MSVPYQIQATCHLLGWLFSLEIQTMLTSITKLFQKPLAGAIVEASVKEYQRQLLEHQASSAYHKKMSEYYAEGLERLQRFKPVFMKTTPGA